MSLTEYPTCQVYIQGKPDPLWTFMKYRSWLFFLVWWRLMLQVLLLGHISSILYSWFSVMICTKNWAWQRYRCFLGFIPIADSLLCRFLLSYYHGASLDSKWMTQKLKAGTELLGLSGRYQSYFAISYCRIPNSFARRLFKHLFWMQELITYKNSKYLSKCAKSTAIQNYA